MKSLRSITLIFVTTLIISAFQCISPISADDKAPAATDKNLTVMKKLFSFGENEKWRYTNCPDDRANLSAGAAGTEFKWTPSKVGDGIILLERDFPLNSIGAPDSISLGVEKVSGGEADTTFVVKDSQGECFFLKPKRIEEGKKMIFWSLPEDLSGTSWPQNNGKDGAKADKKLDMPLSLHELRIISKNGAPVAMSFNSVGTSSMISADDKAPAATDKKLNQK